MDFTQIFGCMAQTISNEMAVTRHFVPMKNAANLVNIIEIKQKDS